MASTDPFSPAPGAFGLSGSLQGRFLIAMPGMEDSRFAQSVIYMCSHSDEGAMGLIVNKLASHISFPDLLSQLHIQTQSLSPVDVPVHVGGPVDTGRGFVLHSRDYGGTASTLPVGDGVALTATTDILRAIADGTGPDRYLLLLGYAGWSAGQLEAEIKSNGWLVSDAAPELVFKAETDDKWAAALAHMGVDPLLLSADAGHA